MEGDDPIVFEVVFLENGFSVESDYPVRLLASGGDGTEVEVEETDDGTYATVQPLPDGGEWELRITGASGGSYVSEWIDATALPATEHDNGPKDHGGDEHDHEPADGASPFQPLLEFGAVVTVIAGSLAVAVEGAQLRNRQK